MKPTRNILIICGILIIAIIIIVLYPKPSEVKSTLTYSTALSPSQLNEMLKKKDFVLINLAVDNKKYIKNTDYEAPYYEYTFIEDYLKKDISKKVVFYSRDGSQSAITVSELSKKGYKNLYYLEGGMDSWVKNEYETTEDLNMNISNMGMGDMGMMNMKKFDLSNFKEMMKNIKLPDKIGSATKDQVSNHNTVEDCWVVVENKVYNLPLYWIEMHPGGAEVYPSKCGKDITEDFKNAHSTEKPTTVLEYFYIGELIN